MSLNFEPWKLTTRELVETVGKILEFSYEERKKLIEACREDPDNNIDDLYRLCGFISTIRARLHDIIVSIPHKYTP